MELEQLKRETQEILLDLLSKSNLRQGQILVLGLSPVKSLAQVSVRTQV